MDCPSITDIVLELIPLGNHRVQVLKVYDGDTFWALFDVQGRKIRNKNLY